MSQKQKHERQLKRIALIQSYDVKHSDIFSLLSGRNKKERKKEKEENYGFICIFTYKREIQAIPYNM